MNRIVIGTSRRLTGAGGRLMLDVADRYRGALLGAAAGSALGAPLEGMSRAEILVSHRGEVRDFLPGRYEAGSYTADVQMMVALATTLALSNGFDVDELALTFGEWMRLHDEGLQEARGYGWASGLACRRLYRGIPKVESAVESDGCDAAVRAVPLGLVIGRPQAVRDTAVLQAMLTHRHPRALAEAAAVALAVSFALWRRPFEAQDFLSTTAKWIEDIDPGFAAKVSNLQGYLEDPLEVGPRYTGVGPQAIEAVPAALLIAAKLHSLPGEAVVRAVNAGGNTAGMGGMTGAIVGSFNGAGAVPKRWLSALESRELLEYLADSLYEIVFGERPDLPK
jgi:ADP-ribosyl-[dinitrogen reductase] hydrolase